MKNRRYNGFHGVLIIMIVAAIAIVGVLGYVFYKNFAKSTKNTGATVRWQYNQQEDKWFVAQGTAPACKQPFVF